MKKKLIFIFLIVLIFIIIYEFRYKLYYKLPFNYKVIVLSIFSNDKTGKKIKNDSKTRFLPETQLVDLNFKKIKIKEFAKEKHEVAHGMYTSLYPTFYIEKFENFVFLGRFGLLRVRKDAKWVGDHFFPPGMGVQLLENVRKTYFYVFFHQNHFFIFS